jgi:hypothetical protein
LLAEAVTALLLRLQDPGRGDRSRGAKGKRLAFVEAKQRRRFKDAGWALPTRAKRRIVRLA